MYTNMTHHSSGPSSCLGNSQQRSISSAYTYQHGGVNMNSSLQAGTYANNNLPLEYANPSAAPSRCAPSGRLANRHKGIITHHPPPPSSIPAFREPSLPKCNILAQSGHRFPENGPANLPSERPECIGQGIQGSFPVSPLQAATTKRHDFLIVGLFALRLMRRIVEQLRSYEGRESDLHWLTSFLRPYPQHCALAKLKDPAVIENYTTEYPRTVKRVIRQPGYIKVFMEMNPDKKAKRELSDDELRAIIDFADAASEWGSTCPIPGKYAQRMEELASRRQVAE